MLNVMALGVLFLFLTWSVAAVARRRMPLSFGVLAWTFSAVMFAGWPLRSVDAKGAHDAVVLSRAGPLGAAAYRTAIADGRITRQELFEIREASGRDLDKEFGLSKPEQG